MMCANVFKSYIWNMFPNLFNFYECRLPRQMSGSSLNPFAERFVVGCITKLQTLPVLDCGPFLIGHFVFNRFIA
jgi:hypothetical protein